MRSADTCPQCGAGLPADAPGGLCPCCLVRAGQAWASPDPTGAYSPNAQGMSLPCSFANYELLEEIARGGMGIVYKARQKGLGRLVAVKMILAGRFASREFLRRFQAEAETIGRLRHPNIVTIHEIGEFEGQPFFSMDYIAGRNLAQLIAETGFTQLGFDRIARWLGTIALAVDHAHTHGVLHRDLKPANILIDADDEPRVTDFGLAKKVESAGGAADSSQHSAQNPLNSLTLSGQVLGSPSYAPPEQAAGRHDELGPASDVYALGAILYHLLAGRPPFAAASLASTITQVLHAEAISPRLLNASVPRDLETICLKCLEKEPRRRYATARDLAEEIGRFLAHEPIVARPVSLLGRALRWSRRQPALALVSLCAGILALLVALGSPLAALRIQRERLKAERLAAREAESRRETEALLLRLEAQRVDELLAKDQAPAALSALAAQLRRRRADITLANRLLWELHRRAWITPSAPPLEHRGYVRTARFSPDGTRVVTASLDGTARIWTAPSGAPLGPPLAHGADVMCAAFSPDSRMVATTSHDGTARIWNGQTGEPITGPLLHGAPVHWEEFSPDSTQMITACDDGLARLWDARSGQLLRQWSGHEGPVIYAEFSADGRQVLTAGQDRTVRLWSATVSAGPARVLPHKAALKQAHFSRDGQWIVSFGDESAAWLWQAGTGQPVGSALQHDGEIASASFSPDGDRVVTAGWDRTVRIWEVPSGRRLHHLVHPTSGFTMAQLDPSGKRLLTAAWDGSARLWDAGTGRPISEAFRQRDGLRWAEISPDGTLVATASRDGTAQLWRVGPPFWIASIGLHGTNVDSALFSPNRRQLAIVSQDHALTTWDTESGAQTGEPWQDPAPIKGLCYSPDGQRLAIATRDGTVRLRDTASGRMLLGPLSARRSIMSEVVLPQVPVVFSPDGRQIATAFYEKRGGTLVVWNVPTGQLSFPLQPHDAWIGSIQFSPDGHRLATGSWDGVARVWRSVDGRPASPPLAHPGQVLHVAFSPDGRTLATGSDDQMARVWDWATGRVVAGPFRQAGPVRLVCFSPDGRHLVTGSHDGTAALWNLDERQSHPPFLEHETIVTAAEFHENGRWLLTVAEERGARVWDLATGEAAGPWLRPKGRLVSAAFGRQTVLLAVAGPDHGLQIIETPLCAGAAPDWLAPLAETVAGLRQGPDGVMAVVSPSDYFTLREQFAGRTNLPAASERWARRFLP